MTDFKITFQADELLYRDYKKMSMISEIMFRRFLRQFKIRTALPPKQSSKTHFGQGNALTIMDLDFLFYVFPFLLAEFYFIRIGVMY